MWITTISRYFIRARQIVFTLSFLVLIFYLFQSPTQFTIVIYLIALLQLGYGLNKILIHKKSLKTSNVIFNLSFSVYSIYMLSAHILYVDNPFTTFYWAGDSIGIWARIDDFAKMDWYNGPMIFDARSSAVQNGTGMDILGWFIGKVSIFLTSTNDIIFHKFIPVWCAALINVFLFNALVRFIDERKALLYTIAYSLFSYNLLYSAILLRDLYIGLFFAISLFLLTKKYSNNNLFMLIGLAILSWIFRPSHGLFSLLFPITYYYIFLKKINPVLNKIYSIIIVLFAVSIIIGNTTLSQFEVVNEKAERYYERDQIRIEEGEGFSKRIYSALPEQLFFAPRIFQSQINPFQFYENAFMKVPSLNSNTVIVQHLSFVNLFSRLFWFVVIIVFIYGFSKKKYRVLLPIELKFFAFLGATLIISSSFALNDTRRLMVIYPFIYVVVIYFMSIIDKFRIKRVINYSVFTFMFFASLYSFIRLV